VVEWNGVNNNAGCGGPSLPSPIRVGSSLKVPSGNAI
jgi:hypothetical protein